MIDEKPRTYSVYVVYHRDDPKNVVALCWNRHHAELLRAVTHDGSFALDFTTGFATIAFDYLEKSGELKAPKGVAPLNLTVNVNGTVISPEEIDRALRSVLSSLSAPEIQRDQTS